MEDSIFEVELDSTELKYLRSLLPKNYSFAEVVKTKPKSRKGSVANTPSVRALTVNNEEINRRLRRKTEAVEIPAPPRSTRGVQLRNNQAGILKQPTDNWLEKSLQILDKIAKDGRAAPFQLPVAQLYGDLPGYSEIVKNPMDISTVRRRILRGHYTAIDQFAKDMRLIWENTYLYNDEECEVYQYAKQLSADFEKLYQGKTDAAQNPSKPKEFIDLETSQGKITPKKIRRNQPEKKVRSRSTKTVVGASKKDYFPKEKKLELLKMIIKIKNQDKSNVNHIYRIVSKYNQTLVGKSEYEIDLEKLPVQALEELHEFSSARLKSMESPTIVSLPKVFPERQEKKRPFDQSVLVQHGSRMAHQIPNEFNRAKLVPQVPQPAFIAQVPFTPDKKDLSKVKAIENPSTKESAEIQPGVATNSGESGAILKENQFNNGFESQQKADRIQESPIFTHFGNNAWGGHMSATQLGTPNQIDQHRPSNFFAGHEAHSMMQSSGVGMMPNSKILSYQSPSGYTTGKMKSSLETSYKPDSTPIIAVSTPKKDTNKSDDSSSSFLTESENDQQFTSQFRYYFSPG